MRTARPGWITDRILLLGREESNVYLLKGEECSIIGGGMLYIVPDVLEQLDRFGIEESSVTHLLILHSHFDHCAIVPFLQKRWPHLRVAASARAKELLSNPKIVENIAFLNQAMITERRLEEKAREMSLTFDGIEVHETVGEGDVLDWGGIRIQILDAPGHSSDSIAAYVPEEKALFASDAGGIPFGDQIFPAGNSNFTKYQHTLERFAALDVEVHLAEHYGAFTGEDARRFIPRSIEAAREIRALIEDSYRRTGSREESTRELTDLFMEKAPAYFLPREVMAMVIGQMVRHIAEEMEKGGAGEGD